MAPQAPDDASIPPLRREALEFLPTALFRLRRFWQTLAQNAPVVNDLLAGFNPEQLPAMTLAFLVQLHMATLHQTFSDALDVYVVLRRLQVMPDYVVENWIEYYDDDVVPTD